jgi:hypothetical protein
MLYHTLRVESSGIAVAFGINGASLIEDRAGDGVTVSRPVDEWIMPHKNLLTGVLFRPPGGAQLGQDAKVKVTLQLHDADGNPPPNMPPLATFRWPVPAIPALYPFPLAIPFETVRAPAARLWQQAEPLDKLAPQDQAAILQQVEEVRTALVAQDNERVFDLMLYKFEDDALVNKIPFQRLREAIVIQFGFLANLVPFGKPLKPGEATFDIIAGGRVVEVARPGNTAIVFQDEERTAALKIFCARIDGKWRIVR